MQNFSEFYFEKNKDINITVKTIDSLVYKVNINPEKSIFELKETLAKLTKIPVKNQRLIYQGKVLKDNDKIKDYKIYNDYVIHLVKQQENPNIGINTNIDNQRTNQIIESNNNLRETNVSNSENDLGNYQNYFQSILNSLNMMGSSNNELGRILNNTNRWEPELTVPECINQIMFSLSESDKK
jgi:hypothetical protein